jgi:hypothetical protein
MPNNLFSGVKGFREKVSVELGGISNHANWPVYFTDLDYRWQTKFYMRMEV